MVDLFSFKELEPCYLKATYSIEIGNRKIEKGEVLATFDKIQIGALKEVKNFVAARGGFDNRAHVYWETTKELPLSFSQGVFSKTQLALLMNSKLVDFQKDDPIPVLFSEKIESDENGEFDLKEIPIRLFLYEEKTGEKISFGLDGKRVKIENPYTEVVAQYTYNYMDGASQIQLGKRLLTGFVELEARTRVKDDTTGQVVTGLFKIPKLKLMSDLSIRLGAQATPVVANFSAVGVPVGSKGSSYVGEFYILSNDIDSDF